MTTLAGHASGLPGARHGRGPSRAARQRCARSNARFESENFQILARDVAPRAAISSDRRASIRSIMSRRSRRNPERGTRADRPGHLDVARHLRGGAARGRRRGLRRRRGDGAQGRQRFRRHPAARPSRRSWRRRWASASSTTRPSPPAMRRRRTGPSASPSSISTSITATARSTFSGATPTSCTPRPTRCRSIPGTGRASGSAASTTRSSTRRSGRATAARRFARRSSRRSCRASTNSPPIW